MLGSEWHNKAGGNVAIIYDSFVGDGCFVGLCWGCRGSRSQAEQQCGPHKQSLQEPATSYVIYTLPRLEQCGEWSNRGLASSHFMQLISSTNLVCRRS